MLKKVLTIKAAALAGVMLLGAGAAGAATNTLPDPAQNAVSSAAERVGLKVKKADHGKAKKATHKPGNGRAKGTDATGPAAKGLCNAYASHTATSTTAPNNGKWANSVAFQNLAEAAKAAGKSIPDYCAGVTAAAEKKAKAEGRADDAEEKEVPEPPKPKAKPARPDKPAPTSTTTKGPAT